MKEFIFLFRSPHSEMAKLSPDEMQAYMLKWRDWTGRLSEKSILKFGDRLSRENAKIVSDFGKVITDGPFIESREIVGGYIIIQTETMDEAVDISKECPIYDVKGFVEIRTSAY